MSKTSKPQLTKRTVTQPSMVPADGPRKPFTRNLTLNVGTRKYLVIGGLAPKMRDGYQPYVTPQRIAAKLGLEQYDCVMADPAEQGKIEAAKAAGLKVYTGADLPGFSTSSPRTPKT